jgi:hypothetical protein
MEQTPEAAPKPATQSWMPVVSGTFCIISGTLGFVALAFLITFGAIYGAAIGREVLRSLGFWQAGLPLTFIGLISIPLVIVNVIAIIGGAMALQRKHWGLAVAGAACAVIPNQVMGILAIVFIVLSRKEFE